MSILLEIISPDRKVYSEKVDSVVLPTKMGEIEILAGHIPLLTILDAGQLIIKREKNSTFLAISQGFARVTEGGVCVLVEAAIHVHDIDLEELLVAQKRAQEALQAAKQDPNPDPTHVESIESFIRFNLAQENIKQNRPRTPHPP